MTELVFASNNIHKLGEIRRLLPEGYIIHSLKERGIEEDLPETGDTIEANALQKALHVSGKYKVNCFADDSGLEIAALNGEPGVHSAYYAGLPRDDKKNIALVLDKLKNNTQRLARFKTVIAFVNNNQHFLFEGLLNGIIATEPRGKNGFGYDPVFIPENSDRTLAEVTPDEKNRISHRARAVRKFLKFLGLE